MATADLEDAHLPELPTAGYYIPDFITEEQSDYILAEIRKLPESRWTVLSHRRLLSLPSQLTGAGRDTLLAASLPQFLTKTILERLSDLRIFESSPLHGPNHCLVNEYEPGQGIMPHEDGPAYFPVTATASLGSHTVLNIYKKNAQGERELNPSWCILQEPRSLLVTTDQMYKDTIHGISEVKEDENLGPATIINWEHLGNKAVFETGSCKRELRVSLTYREVLKVAKLGGAMKFINKR